MIRGVQVLFESLFSILSSTYLGVRNSWTFPCFLKAGLLEANNRQYLLSMCDVPDHGAMCYFTGSLHKSRRMGAP